MYAIHNTSRGRNNRTLRATNPTHDGHKQYVLSTQQRLVRGRPLMVPDEVLKANLVELQAKSKVGLIEVRTVDGRVVNLETLMAAPPVPVPPLPAPFEDTVEKDMPAGIPVPLYPDGPTESEMQQAISATETSAPQTPSVVADEVEYVESESKAGKRRNRR